MAHDVSFRVPDRPVGQKDLIFSVKKNGTRFGRLKVSKGCIVWLPGWKSKGYRLNWNQLDRAAREHGRWGRFPI